MMTLLHRSSDRSNAVPDALHKEDRHSVKTFLAGRNFCCLNDWDFCASGQEDRMQAIKLATVATILIIISIQENEPASSCLPKFTLNSTLS